LDIGHWKLFGHCILYLGHFDKDARFVYSLRNGHINRKRSI